MRVKEILHEITLNIPDQMVTVQIPLSAISQISTDDDPIINPGKRAGEDGKYRWSPPLQQHLDATKDAVGPSNDAIDVDSAEEIEANKDHSDDQQPDQMDDFKKRLAAILSRTPSVLG